MGLLNKDGTFSGLGKQAVKKAKDAGLEFDLTRKAHVLTDKPEVKVVPCRVCKRPCIVTRFATVAKVACKDHRERKADVQKVREFDESLEPHTLTDKEKTKRVPCRACGRPCIVNTFAAPGKVACLEHGGSQFQPKKVRKESATGEVSDVEIVYDAAELEHQRELLHKPSLPYWPAGEPEDRKRLIELATAAVALRCTYDDLQAEWIKTRRDPARELEQKQGEVLELKGMKQLSENEKTRLTQLQAGIVTLEKKAAKPDKLIEVETKLEDAEAARRHQREKMVKALTDRGVENPHAEEQDADVQVVQQIPVRHDLDKRRKAGVA